MCRCEVALYHFQKAIVIKGLDDWKRANITPFFKVKKDLETYRPAGLSSVKKKICKTNLSKSYVQTNNKHESSLGRVSTDLPRAKHP